MEAAVKSCCFCFLLLSVFSCDGFHVLGPSGPLTVQLGDSVLLPCFVETPLPMKGLEVEWRRDDSGSLVHLWQDGESRPESQDQRYHERAHFFTEEIIHGNFSLILTSVTQEDVGVYKCVVYTNLESDETLIEIKEIEHLVVTGDTNISANVGEDITLSCSVDSHIAPENIEEISWKKVEDEDILVLPYVQGEVLTDSSHERYRDRVEFFSAEERNKGNFSLRLRNVRTEDIGLYTCEALSGELSAKTKVKVVLGFSPMHIGICFLCTLCISGLLLLSFPAFTLKSNVLFVDTRLRPIHWAHVLFPNITMSIAFILWGVDDGFLPEAATCLALNLLRIPCLFWITPYLKKGRFIRSSAIPLEYNMIIAVAYSIFLMNPAHKVIYESRVLCLVLLILGSFLTMIYLTYFARNAEDDDEMNWAFLATEVINLQCILAVIVMYKEFLVIIAMAILLFPLMFLICLDVYIWNYLNFADKVKSLRWTSVLLIFQLLYALGSFYTHYDLVALEEEREALYCLIIFVHILSVMTAFKHPHNISALSCSVVYMLGTVVVVSVNAVALLVKVILKARNGQSSVNLRVILLLTESVFAMCCLALQLSPFWKWIQERTSGTQSGCKLCCCKQT